MEIKEKAFPRGGKKPALFKSSKSSSFSIFRQSKPKVKKKIKKTKKVEINNFALSNKKGSLASRYVEDLNASHVHEGMLLLGIVSQVTENVVSVSLPGSLRGGITLSNVSEFYKNLIANMTEHSEIPSLTEIFHSGDVLPVKVISVSEEHHSLVLTCDPKEINYKLSYDILEQGLILSGSVKSKEDYGFLIDFGIAQTSGFLHFDKLEANKVLKIGQVVRCAVIKISRSNNFCNIQASLLKKDLLSAVVNNESCPPVICFIPGFQFKVTFKKILMNGVEVKYNKTDASKGYIHEDQLLNKFPKLQDVELESESIATLLYIKPFVNFLYLKIMPKNLTELPFQYGEIVSGKVMKTKRSGIIAKVIDGSRKAKCFIPFTKLKNTSKLLEDKSNIESLYPVNKKLPKIRLGIFDQMGRFYLGATDKDSLCEKYFSVSDLKVGEIVPCSIISFGEKSAFLRIGRSIKGVVYLSDMTDIPLKNPKTRFKVDQKVKARVTEILPEKRYVRLTMKPSLLKEKKILRNYKYKKDESYLGVISKVFHSKLIIKFFNYVHGVVLKRFTAYPDATTLQEHFSVGQVVKCYVISGSKNEGLFLSLVGLDSNTELNMGQKYEVEVTNKNQHGLYLKVQLDNSKICSAFLPKQLLTSHQDLVPALLSTYSSGEKFEAYCVCTYTKNELPLFGNCEIFNDFYEGKTKREFDNIFHENSVIPFLFKSKNVKTKRIFLRSLVPGKNNFLIRVQKDDFQNDESNANVLHKHQVIYGKILNIQENRVDVSIKLTDVWDKNFHISLDLLDSYFKTTDFLISRQKTKQNLYNDDTILGSPVKGIIEEARTGHAIVKMENGELGLVQGSFTKGEEVTGKIVWIDGTEQMIHIIVNFNTNEESDNKELSFMPENDYLRGKVVYIHKNFIAVQLKGRAKKEFAYLPQKRHLNDFFNVECPYSLGDQLKVWVTIKKSKHLLAMDRRVVALKEKIIWKNAQNKLKDSIKSIKRKFEQERNEQNKKSKTESDSEYLQIIDEKLNSKNGKNGFCGDIILPEVKQEIEDDDVFNVTDNVPHLEYDDIEIKEENEGSNAEDGNPENYLINNDERIPLSSSSESEGEEECSVEISKRNENLFKVGFNWEVLKNNNLLSGIALRREESSSEEENEESKSEKKKRRKLTSIEKREKAKTEEQRLRCIEERLLTADQNPETVDDFDRAVITNPDSSEMWLKYMAFHIQGTEIEKARAVARRALKAISFRKEQEKLNIWIALLNLENLYGNEDSLNKILGEALQSNDPYKIHIHVINMQGKSNKFQEMEKLGNFILKKYKDNNNMWVDLATAYFSVGKIESSRNVLQKAMAITDKSRHVSLISKFAHLENTYGSPERAQTLYESILSSFPKRIDIWCCYVDMLVKSNYLDLARQVLERATSQSLRPRKMKTLFKKFITFEETHGTPENVEKVREAAVEYVETVGGLED